MDGGSAERGWMLTTVLEGKMLVSDSSGRYSSQFFIGDGFWLGSITLCESLDPKGASLVHHQGRHQRSEHEETQSEEEDGPTTPVPTLSSVEHETSVREKAPYPVAFVSLQLHMQLPKEFQPSERVITLGFCIPHSCASSQHDAKLISRYLTGANGTEIATEVPKGPGVSLTISSVRKVPGDYEPLKDSTFVTLLTVAAILVLMMASGTALDVMDRKSKLSTKYRPRMENKMDWMNCEKQSSNLFNGKSVECNGNHLTYVQGSPAAEIVVPDAMDEAKKRNFGARIVFNVKGVLMCFSLRYNVPKLFEKPPPVDHAVGPSLTCLHGLRVFSLIWVITGHGCLVAMTFVDNKSFRGIVEKDFLFQSVSNGAFSVDTFFFISGLLVSYLFCKAIARPVVDAVNNRSIKSDVIKFVGILTYRFIRLTPTYLIAIAMVEVTARWLKEVSIFPPPTLDDDLCPKYWWRNILYINTFYPVDQMCMVWSWYLADDTQFYTLGVILLLLSTRHFRTALASGLLILVSSWFTTGIITYIAKHSPSIEDPFSLFDELYDKPWTRLGPYMVGMAVGYLLTQEVVYKKISKVASAIAWMLCTAVTFSLVYGLYGRKIGPLESAAHTALSHTTWGLAMGWIVICCGTGRGGPVNAILSNRVFVPFSRLSFCAYLVHPIVMFAVYMHSDAPYHLTRDSMVMTIGGFILSSYMLAFVVSMSIEAPSIRLLEFIHPIKKKLREEEERSKNASSTTLSS
ncbi:nose resistant to fluoxetine protein 6-like [Ischnura elegans]|uniref:nose resistant to fluoxetine protein 6-like n=1 Tax=Ischnura elegans TaxID=197161 RepID=UPI001ED868DB|nr:nose resistant to fluoxetine protein 6-like [Ischnura elegans]